MPKDELRISLSPPRLSALRNLSQMVEAFGATNGLPEAKIYLLNLVLDGDLDPDDTQGAVEIAREMVAREFDVPAASAKT